MAIEKVLIDLDILRYELGSLTERHPFIPTASAPLSRGLLERKVHERIEGIFDKVGTRDYKGYFTGANNFRFEIAKQFPYKGTRVGLEKPANWKLVEEILKTNYNNIETVEFAEADDYLAIEQRSYMKQGIVSCIASRDKDLDTVPGWRYRWKCGDRQEERLYYVTEIEALRWFYTQCLTGDPTDGILGCGYIHKLIGKKGDKKGVGYFKKRGIRGAEALLRDCTNEKEMYDIVRQQYVKMFSEHEADELMLESSRLLYMGSTGLHDLYNFPDFTEAP